MGRGLRLRRRSVVLVVLVNAGALITDAGGWAATTRERPSMTTQVPDSFAPLSADFVHVIPNGAVSVFVGRIRHVEATARMVDGLSTQTGSLTIEVIETVSNTGPSTGNLILVGFHQIADIGTRLRNGRDQWNHLNLAEGQILLLACKPEERPGWQAVAARGLRTATDSEVWAVRRSYSIERNLPGAEHLALTKALGDQNPDLLAYTLDVLGERNALGRTTSVRLMADAIEHTDTPSTNRKEIGSTLTRIFPSIHDDPRLQLLIVQTLASALVNERDEVEQATWASRLASCVLHRSISRQDSRVLIHGVSSPTNAEVAHRLTTMEHNATAIPSSADRRTLAELAERWRNAVKL